MSLQLDGGNRVVATDFIKLEITGSSNLATEQYVLDQVALGGGGGTSTTDLSGYYNLTQTNTLLDSKYSITETNTLLDTKYSITETNTLLDSKYSITQTNTLLDTKYSITQTNTLLDTKLDINNPQDMDGTLRIGHITGTSKIILNAVASSKDLYVNGDSEVNGNFLATSIDSTNYIKGSSLISNTINADNTNDIFFQSNSTPYAQFDYADDCFRFVKNVDAGNITCNGNLNINSIDTLGDVDMVLKQNNVNFLELKTDDGIIANQLIQCGQNLKTQEIDTIAPLDMILKVSGDSVLELKADDRIVANKLIQCGSNLKTQEIDTIAPLDLTFKVSGTSKLQIAENLTTLNTKTECVNTIVCDTFESRSASTVSNYIMNDNTGEIKFYVGSPVSPDTTTNLVMTLENNLITFHKPTSPEIGGGTIDDSNYVKKTGENSQLIVSETYFQATALQSFRFSLGGPQQFAQYKKFEIYNTEVIAYMPFKCTNNLGIQTNLINSFTNVDLVFQQNSINYMTLNAGLSSVDINASLGIRSNIYNSIDNVDVSFRRNNIDFFYLRNGQVETNTGVSLYSADAKLNNIDTTGNNDMIFSRNNIEYFRLDGANNIVNVETSKSLSSNYLYCNYLRTRTLATNDMIFEGSNTAGNGYTEFMRLRKDEEDVMISKDVTMLQEKRLYLSKTTGQEHYIHSRNVAGAHHIYVSNEDPNGDIRFFTKRNNAGTPTLSVAMFVTPTKVSVPPPYTLEGDLVDTSDFTKKYDIKNIEHHFTNIIKQVEPKTFKMEEEKELGITKNHIGFIADEVLPVIPPEWENIIVTDNEGIKKLSYIKMGSITWGAVRELIEENQEMKSQIEHLESRLFEVENFIKDFVKPKPKAKAKPKAKK